MKKLFFLALIAQLALTFSSAAQSGIITTIAGTPGVSGYSGDGGPATAAQIFEPSSLGIDPSGNVYFFDLNYRIRKVDLTGFISTIIGTSTFTPWTDGAPATASSLRVATDIVFDASGNLYFGEISYIRKIDNLGIISTFAGTTSSHYSGDSGPATNAGFSVSGLTRDAAGNFYIADGSNYRIRKIDPSGIITTIAGTGVTGYSGDGGPATAAELGGINSIFFDVLGNIYFFDGLNYRIRKIDGSGVISTIAGTGIRGYSGDGGPATASDISYVESIVADGAGNIYFSLQNDNRVRMINPAGIVTTIVGDGTCAYTGDGGPATAAEICRPRSLAFNAHGDLVIADDGNNVIRIITPDPLIKSEVANKCQFKMYPNPAKDNSQVSGVRQNTSYTLMSITGVEVSRGQLTPANTGISLHSLPSGVYVVVLTNSEGVRENVRVVKE